MSMIAELGRWVHGWMTGQIRVTESMSDQQVFDVVTQALANKTYRKVKIDPILTRKLTLSQVQMLSVQIDEIKDQAEQFAAIRVVLNSFWINSFIAAESIPHVSLSIIRTILDQQYHFGVGERHEFYPALIIGTAGNNSAIDIVEMIIERKTSHWLMIWAIRTMKTEHFRKFWSIVIKHNTQPWHLQPIFIYPLTAPYTEEFALNLAYIINSGNQSLDISSLLTDLTLHESAQSAQDAKQFVLNLMCKGVDLQSLFTRYNHLCFYSKHDRNLSTKLDSLVKSYRSLILPILIPVVGRDVGGLVFEYVIGPIDVA